MKKSLFIILLLFLSTSCEKEVDLDIADQSGRIVIEGNINDQPGPYIVRITKSAALTQNNQYSAVTGAEVIVNDNTGQTETLQYVGDGKYQTTAFTGVTGRTYTLKIVVEGKQYTAQSTMPTVVDFEGLKQDSFVYGGQTNYTILPIFTDPIVLGNRYLISFSINNFEKTSVVFSDNINNGLINKQILILPNSGYKKVKKGDNIDVEMQCIDNNIFVYYSAFLQILENNDSTFGIMPNNPPSNINNGALGYFSAHTIRKKSIIIQ